MPSSRRRAWADTRLNGVSLVAGTPFVSDLLVNAPEVDTLTVVRIVADITVQYVVSNTIVDSLSNVDLGIGVSSIEAFAVAGAAGLPDPSVDDQYPPRGWIYVNNKPVSQQAESTGVVNSVAHFEFDIRSMRKIDKGRLFMVMDQTNITVGGAMQIVGRVRALCLT